MDTPNTDSSLSVSDAAQAISAILSPEEPKEDQQASDATPQTTEEDAQATPQEADQTVPVVIDGKTIEVPLKEVVSSYQKDKASTERFMQAAETRKAADAEIAKTRQEREAYAQNLNRMQAMLEGVQQETQKIDWAKLIKEDPVEYLKQQHLASQRQEQLNQIRQEQQRVGAQMQAEGRAQFEHHLAGQQQELLKALPEWSDGTRANTERSQLRDYLLKAGYDEAAVNNVSNAKDVILARKAMLYDQMISKAQAATKKVSNLPTKVERPGVTDGNPSLDKRTAAYQRLAKSGKVEDAAAVFSSLL